MSAARGSRTWFDSQYAPLEQGSADGFGVTRRGSQGVRLAQIAALLRRQPPCPRLLDVGCGTGTLLAMLEPAAFPRRVGSDLSGTGLRHAARTLPGGAWVQSALPHLPFASGSFDGVVCLEVLYYLDGQGRRAAMQELARVTRPGGWLCLSARLDDGSRYLAPHTLPELAREAGLEVAKTVWHRAWLYRPLEQGLKTLARHLDYLAVTTRRIGDGQIPPEAWQTWKWRVVGELSRHGGSSWMVDLLQGLLRALAWSVEFLLRLHAPVWLAYALGGLLFPQRSRTGQVLLCRKMTPIS